LRVFHLGPSQKGAFNDLFFLSLAPAKAASARSQTHTTTTFIANDHFKVATQFSVSCKSVSELDTEVGVSNLTFGWWKKRFFHPRVPEKVNVLLFKNLKLASTKVINYNLTLNFTPCIIGFLNLKLSASGIKHFYRAGGVFI